MKSSMHELRRTKICGEAVYVPPRVSTPKILEVLE